MTEAERERVLTMFTIFQNPSDHPGKFVLRGFDVLKGVSQPQPHAVHVVCDTLEQIREAVPRGLYCLGRDEGDHPSVVETWL